MRERRAGLGADIGMLSAAAALCSVAHHLGRALVTGYPISFISPSPSDMIGVALFLAMFAPVAVPRYYYCWVALGELDRWYGSPEGRERKPGWLNEQYSGLWAVFGFMLLVVSPLCGLWLVPDRIVLFDYYIYPSIILYWLASAVYWVIARLLKRGSQNGRGDSGWRALCGLGAALFLAAASVHLLVSLVAIISSAITVTAACVVVPIVMLALEFLASLLRHRNNGGAPGGSLRFVAKEGAKLIRNEFVPVLFGAMIGALLLGMGFILPWSELRLGFVGDTAEALGKTEVVDVYGGERLIIKKEVEGEGCIYSQVNLSDGYWVEAE